MQIFYGSPMDAYKDPKKINISLKTMCECVRYVCRFFQNVNISFEICVNVFQLIQNVNISFEICANVSGMCADSFKMLIFSLKYI